MRFWLLLTLLVGLAGCRGVARRFEPENLFSRYKPSILRSDQTYKKLVIEIIAAETYEPGSSVSDYVISKIKPWCKKPDGYEIVETRVPLSQVPPRQWRQKNIDEFQAKWASRQTSGSTLVVHVLYLPGLDNDAPDFIAACAYSSTGIAVYPDRLRTGTATPTSILLHEFGHLLGLVNVGTPAISGHVDQDHCESESCVMYYIAPPTWMPDFDEDCQRDLRGP